MRQLGALLVAFFAVGACRTAPEANKPKPEALCKLDPTRCEQLCAGCDDVSACFRNGGECLMRDGTPIYYRDFVDKDDDIFAPGCHYSFSDAACTQNGAFVNGDSCASPTTLAEYTLTLPCHDGCAAARDCDVECLLRGLGSGKCQRVPHFCGPNQHSARCVCDKQPPPPEPLPTNPT